MVSLLLACRDSPWYSEADQVQWEMAQTNGALVNEGLERCRLFVKGWLVHADEKTGLIPRNLKDGNDIWNAKDAAADNYPFMVLTAALTDSILFHGRMMDILRTEVKVTFTFGQSTRHLSI